MRAKAIDAQAALELPPQPATSWPLWLTTTHTAGTSSTGAFSSPCSTQLEWDSTTDSPSACASATCSCRVLPTGVPTTGVACTASIAASTPHHSAFHRPIPTSVSCWPSTPQSRCWGSHGDSHRAGRADETRILENYVHAREAKSVRSGPLTSLHRQPVLQGMACAVGTSPRDTTAS